MTPFTRKGWTALVFALLLCPSAFANPPEQRKPRPCLSAMIREWLGWTEKGVGTLHKKALQASRGAAAAMRRSTPEMNESPLSTGGDFLEIKLEDKIKAAIQEAKQKFQTELKDAREKDLSLYWIALWKYRILKARMLRPESQRAPAALLEDKTLSILNDLVANAGEAGRSIDEQAKIIEGWAEKYGKQAETHQKLTDAGFAALFNLIQTRRALIKIKENNKAGATLTLAKQDYEFNTEAELEKLKKEKPSEYTPELKGSQYNSTEFVEVSRSKKELEEREKNLLAQVRHYLGPMTVEIVRDVPVITPQGKAWPLAEELMKAEIEFAHLRNRLDLVHSRLSDLERDLARKQGDPVAARKLQQVQSILIKIEEAYEKVPLPSKTAKMELGKQYFEKELEGWEKGYQHFSSGLKDDVLIHFFSKTGKYRGVMEALSGFPFMGWIRNLMSPRYLEIKLLGSAITLGSLFKSWIEKKLETKPTPEEICAQEKDFKKFLECVNIHMKARHPDEFENAMNDLNRKPLFEADGSTLKPEFETELDAFREAWKKAQKIREEEEEMRKRLAKPAEDYFKMKLGELYQKSQSKEQAALQEALLKHIGSIPDPEQYNQVVLAYLVNKHKEPLHRIQALWVLSHDSRRTDEEKANAFQELQKNALPIMDDLKKIIEYRRKTVEATPAPETDEEKQKKEAEALNQIMKELFQPPTSDTGASMGTPPQTPSPQTPQTTSPQKPLYKKDDKGD